MSKWLDRAKELYAIAETGLHYTADIYDRERYERLVELSNEMLAHLMDESLSVVEGLRMDESGHQTPKIDTRGAVWKDGKILLVQEKDGLWALPGGWMDVTETLSSNVKKEIREESGCEVKVNKIIGLLDRNIHNPGSNPYTIVKVFIQCEYISGSFISNSETIAMDFFDVENLPPLMERKTSIEQVKMCYEAFLAKDNWTVLFD